MISFEEAYQIVLGAAIEFPHEQVPLHKSLGRVLASDIVSDGDSPAFDRAAMDGYAVRLSDIGQELDVIETIAAGDTPQKNIEPRQCAKIMTGAMTPQGADAVIMVEDTELTESGKMRYTKEVPPNICDANNPINPNIRFRGEDCKKGDIIITKGTIIGTQHIAMMAGVGIAQPQVSAQCKVGVLVTGSELVEIDQVPQSGQIRNSNGAQVMSQVGKLGFPATYYGIAPDNKAETLKLVQKAKAENDLLIMSGGVSMGDFDYVPEVLKETGFDMLFRKVAVQPGKPTLFGRDGSKFCFGLPGNPVSAFIQFELMVKPFLLKLSGAELSVLEIRMPTGEDFSRPKAKRLSLIPIRISDGKVFSIRYNGSGHINALGNADGFIAFPVGIKHIKTGELVSIRQI